MDHMGLMGLLRFKRAVTTEATVVHCQLSTVNYPLPPAIVSPLFNVEGTHMSQGEVKAAETSGVLRRCWRVAGPDGVRVVGLFFLACLIGAIYVTTWGGTPEFWQQVFGPAVMTACGRGYTNPMMSEVPGLEDFLYLRSESFDCAKIPENVTLLPEDTSGMTYDEIQAFHPLQQFPGWTQWQRFHRYLVLSVALMFTVFGVAWQSLTPLYALLYGATNALGYGLFRLGMGRRFATFLTILLMTSPLHLQQLPQLRDYSKAPFFFAILLAAGWIVKRPLPLRVQVPLAAIAGFVGGLGLGFRQDVSIAAALFCGLVALFSAGSFRRTWWKRGIVLAVFIGTFAIFGWPILQVLSRVNNAPHDTIIGFAKYCDQRLGVEAPLYDFGDPFLDEYVRAILMGYANRTTGRTEVFRHYSPDYDAAGRAYFHEMVYTFPGDMIIRGYASVLRICDELQISSADATPRGITNEFLARLWQWRRWALDALPGAGRYHVALMLLCIAAVNPRLGAAFFCSILLLAGYPALRFSERHAFHMEILALFAAGFLLQWSWRLLVVAWKGRHDWSGRASWTTAKRYAFQGGCCAALAATLLIVPLGVARGWQTLQVSGLIRAYEEADKTPLLTDISADGELIHIGFSDFGNPTRGSDGSTTLPTFCDVLVLEFSPGETAIPVHFTFDAQETNFQFDRTLTVPSGQPDTTAPTRVYYPVYYGDSCRFTGFTIPRATADRFRSAYVIRDLRDETVLLNAVVTPDWVRAPKYQQLTR